MKMMPFIKRVTAQYRASDALVLPVEAQAARLALTIRAWVKAADIPLSLKLPEGFIPSYCRRSSPPARPTYLATDPAFCRSVWPSPIVTAISGGAKGKSSRKRQTPLKAKGSWRRDHLLSNQESDVGGRRR